MATENTGWDGEKCFNNLKDARRYALNFSKKNPGNYITLYACFGLFVHSHKRLNVFAPSDSYGKSYWLNGKEKNFSEKQVIADQNATPTMF